MMNLMNGVSRYIEGYGTWTGTSGFSRHSVVVKESRQQALLILLRVFGSCLGRYVACDRHRMDMFLLGWTELAGMLGYVGRCRTDTEDLRCCCAGQWLESMIRSLEFSQRL